MMYIFIDESGDIGLDLTKKGTSRYFIMVALLCCDHSTQILIKQAIKKTIKNKINYGRKKRLITELKGSETAIPTKQYFYNHLHSNESWELYSIVIDKNHFNPPIYIKNSASLYDLFTGYLVNKILLNNNIDDDIVLTMYKSKPNKEIIMFNQHIEGIFYSQTTGRHKIIINHDNSYNDKILQAVDLFSNGIYRKYEKTDFEWYDCFKNKIKLEFIL